MPDAIDVVLSQLLAASVPGAAFAVIYKRRFFHPRYRPAILAILGVVFVLQLFFVLASFEFLESRLEWRLRQEGVTTTARILSSYEGGSNSKRFGHGHLNWDHYWEVTCEYADEHGVKYRGEVEVLREMPHTLGGAVTVRYLPADPAIVREEYRIREAKEPPSKSQFMPIAWVANAIVLAWLYFRTVRKKSRAIARGTTDFPY